MRIGVAMGKEISPVHKRARHIQGYMGRLVINAPTVVGAARHPLVCTSNVSQHGSASHAHASRPRVPDGRY